MMIKDILSYCKKNKCSDVHISSDSKITLRLDGKIIAFPNSHNLSSKEVYSYIKSITTERQMKDYLNNLEIDFALQIDSVLRFRANAFHTIKGPAVVFREIPLTINSLEELNLPSIVKSFANIQNGLVLIVGPTGHGKSTTISSLIDLINRTKSKHIITIEDPVEFVHSNKKSIINQREIGASAKSFPLALHNALREDPDIILVGEMRDLETIQLALTAAETGHLVFATLHTSSAVHTINRIIDVFPASSKPSIRSMLSSSLKVILSQHLLPGVNGGRYPAYEIMFTNNSIRNLIREDNLHQIHSVMEMNKRNGMFVMKDSVKILYEKGIISKETYEEGLLYC